MPITKPQSIVHSCYKVVWGFGVWVAMRLVLVLASLMWGCEALSEVFVASNFSVDLQCPLGPEVFWMHKEQLVSTEPVFSLISVQQGDGGVYECFDTNDNSHTIEVHVVNATQVVPGHHALHVDAGMALDKQCPVIVDSRLNESSKVVWTHANESWISPRLQLPYLTQSMSGLYKCRVTTALDSVETGFRLNVDFARPKLAKTDFLINAEVGHDVVLWCNVTEAIPWPEIEWRYRERVLDDRRPNLRLNNVSRKAHEGKYVCTATNEYGHDRFHLILNVLRPLSTSDLKMDMFVESGVDVFLDCGHNVDIDARSNVEFAWSKINDTFGTYNQSVLTIKKAVQSDSGQYVCHINRRDTNSSLERSFKLVVISEPPTLTTMESSDDPMEIFAAEDNKAEIVCPVSGVPTPKISWQRQNGGADFLFDSRFHLDSSILHISSVSKSDADIYKCEAVNMYGNLSVAIKLVVVGNEQRPPILVQTPNKTTVVLEGTKARLSCVAKGWPWPQVKWKSNLEETKFTVEKVINNDTVTSILETVSKLSKEDELRFECRAFNEGGDVNAFTRIVVAQATVVDVGNISEDNKDEVVHHVRAGDRVRVPCRVSLDTRYNRLKSIEWQRLNNNSNNSNNNDDDDNNNNMDGVDFGMDGSLVLPQAQKRHEGLYRCTVTTMLDREYAEFSLAVMANAPVITSSSEENQVVFEDSSISLVCVANGIPRPEICWHMNGTAKLIENDSEIRIENAIQSDSGKYTCTATNDYGQTRRQLRLRVLPIPEDRVLSLQEAKNQELKCVDDDQVQLKWVFISANNNQKNSKNGNYEGVLTQSSPILLLNEPRAGKFVCMMETLSGDRRNFTTTITPTKDLKILSEGGIVKAKIGQKIDLLCKVDQEILISKRIWKFNGQTLNISDEGPFVIREDRLEIEVGKEQEGIFECRLSTIINFSSQTNAKDELRVQYELIVIELSPICSTISPVSITKLARLNASRLSVSWQSDVNIDCLNFFELCHWTNLTQSPYRKQIVDKQSNNAIIDYSDYDEEHTIMYIQINVMNRMNQSISGLTKSINMDELDYNLLNTNENHYKSNFIISLIALVMGLICSGTLLLCLLRLRRRSKRRGVPKLRKESRMSADFMQNLSPQWPEPEEPQELFSLRNNEEDQFIRRPQSISSSWSSLFNVSGIKSSNSNVVIRPIIKKSPSDALAS